MTITPLFPGHGEDSDPEIPSETTAGTPIDIEDSLPHCMVCGGEFRDSSLFSTLRVCPNCRFHYNIGARDRINALTDVGSFDETHRWIESLDPLVFSPRLSYQVRILRDQTRTGLMDAAVGGTAEIGGVPCALIVIDFSFLGGSMGLVVGEKVARIFEHAARERLPVVAIATSGGARIQEGVLSLTQMAKTIVAARHLRDQGLPLISVLGNPSTGQILASFASAADIRIGEPYAHIGFSPLGVLREVEDALDVTDRTDAETLLANGHLDRVVDRELQRNELATLLQMFSTATRSRSKTTRTDRVYIPSRSDAWRSVQLARRPDRPQSRDYIALALRNFVELHGDRVSGDVDEVVIGPAYLGLQPVMVIAQQRSVDIHPDDTDEAADDADDEIASFTDVYGYAELNRGGTSATGFRKARRAARIAADFRLPVVVFIDTPGPAIGIGQELSGLAGEISETIDLMLQLETPVLSVLIGEGGGEAALAFGISDRLLMMEHAIYTPISPESGAETELRDRTRAPEIARSLRLTSFDAMRLGIVDRVIEEPEGGAHTDPTAAARALRIAMINELSTLIHRHRRSLARRRRKKFRHVGEYGPQFRAAVREELNQLKDSLRAGVRRVLRTQAREEDSKD